MPLGGNRHGAARTYVNLFITMTLGGLWHGAAWTFIFWGMLHGLGLAVERVGSRALRARGRGMPPLAGWVLTMAVVLAGWFLFRARSWDVVLGMAGALANLHWTPGHSAMAIALLALAVPVALVEWWQAHRRGPVLPVAMGTVARGDAERRAHRAQPLDGRTAAA